MRKDITRQIELSPPTIEQVIAYIETTKEDINRRLDKTINVLKAVKESQNDEVENL